MRGAALCFFMIASVASPVASLAAAAGPASRPATSPDLDPVIESVDFRGSTLEKAIDALRERSKVNIVVRWHALEAAGIDRAAPVELRVTNMTLLRLLELLGDVSADHVPLGARIERGVVIVSTRDDLADVTAVRLYDVRELVESDMAVRTRIEIGATTTMPAAEPTTQEAYEGSLEQLKHVIYETIDADSWREAGGTIGSIHDFNGQLIIAQTPMAHERIKKLLDELRRK